MDAVGVICEYNPLHEGHARHLAEARRRSGCAAVVCVMSGNYVQRGEPAIFGKYARAEAAVRCGADLVVALPLPWALSSAEGFARGGAAILDALGVEALCYGSESGDTEPAERTAAALLTPAADEAIREELAAGISYAEARQRAAERLAGPGARALRSPNDLLGMEYIRALRRRHAAIRPIAVPREGAAHDGTAEDGPLSASAIRAALLRGGYDWRGVPEAAAAVFRRETAAGRGPVFMGDLENAVLARLRTMPDEAYDALPGGAEGFTARFRRCARSEPTYQGLLDAVKTKRYAMSRIRRTVLYAYLGIRAEDLAGEPPYIQVLAFSAAGRALLAEARTRAALPVLTKPAAVRRLGGRAEHIFTLEAAADDLYALAFGAPEERRGGGAWRAGPVRPE